MDLEGTVIVVTGGARGIGRAIAQAYADRGARVAIVDILADQVQSTANEMREAGANVLSIHTDITIPSQVDEMVARVKDELGAIDILVNNAGSLSALGPVWAVDREKWFRDVTVNLYGTFLCCQAIASYRIFRKGIHHLLTTLGKDAKLIPTITANPHNSCVRNQEKLSLWQSFALLPKNSPYCVFVFQRASDGFRLAH